ncbi:MAG: PAS domain-containing sensor histidine kinase [Burkholderiales bacterium]|nr:PAS domain-containing sensor histidine kinase [Burkholderiales bacterium]
MTTGAAALAAVPVRVGPYWHSLFYFNVYRLIVAAVLLLAAVLFPEAVVGSRSPNIYLYGGVAYICSTALFFLSIRSRRPEFNTQIGMQVCADVLFVSLLTYASGGVSSGLGLLLLASLAAAGIISRGRMTLFFASLASIAVLLEHIFDTVYRDGAVNFFVQAGLLSVGYFATAWLAHTLARYTQASEQLAAQREVDLASMAHVNQLVIQDMQDGVLVVDEHGAIRQINRRAVEILGPLSRATSQLSLAEYAPALAERLQRWRQDPGADFDPLRTVLTNKLAGARFVPVGRNRNRGAVIFLEDLTRIQAEAQQMKLAAMGRLTANIAHEIRNPLSAINHAAELLLEEQNLNETHKRLLTIVHDNTQRLDRMVQDVLKLNRRDRAHRETFLVGDFLRTFVSQFCQIEKVPEDVISLHIEHDGSVTFDRSHLNQIMWNLCRNALRYCQRKRASIRLTLGVGPLRNALELHVHDDGPGVPEAIRPHLFEPFFTTAASGTGLGLYIAREICDANNASLEYIEHSGTGAHFLLAIRGAKL